MNLVKRSLHHLAFTGAALAAVAVAGASATGGCRSRSEGENIFATVCANCHGKTGGGGVATSPNGVAPANFRDPAFHKSRSDEDIRRAITQGKPRGMPAFGGSYDEKQIAELVLVVRGFCPEK
jgi:cytochrome c oxidase cbb3-type subunit 3